MTRDPDAATAAAVTDTPHSTALHDLVADGTLTPDQARRVAARLAAVSAPSSPAVDAPPVTGRMGGRLAEIAGYAGGALLLGAVLLFLTSGWADLRDASRTAILAGTAVPLLGGGALVAVRRGQSLREFGRRRESARRRLTSVLWTLAATSAAGAAGIAAGDWTWWAAGAAGLGVAGLTYALVPSAVGQLGAWLAAVVLLAGSIDEVGNSPDSASYAVALVLLSAAWAGLAVRGLLRERETGLALATGIALIGAQLPVIDDAAQGLGYGLTAIVAIAGFAGFLWTRSWAVLAGGVLATTLVVPEALHDWSDGSVSAAGSLLIAGLTLLAASAAGLRLRHEAR